MIYKVKRFSEHKNEKAIDLIKAAGFSGLGGLGVLANNKIANEHLKRSLVEEIKLLQQDGVSCRKLNDLVRNKRKELNLNFANEYKGDSSNRYIPKKNMVVLDEVGRRTASIFPHEVGHAEIQHGKAGKFMKKLQSSPPLLYHQSAKISSIAHGGAGFAAGYTNGKRIRKGEKESKVLSIGTRVAPLALGLPALVVEAVASRRGRAMLREAGISEKIIKAAKKSQRCALSNHAIPVVKNTALNELGYQGGKLLGKYTGKDNN